MKFLVYGILLIMFLIGLYGTLNYIMFMNFVESPLPESEEVVPDLNLAPE